MYMESCMDFRGFSKTFYERAMRFTVAFVVTRGIENVLLAVRRRSDQMDTGQAVRNFNNRIAYIFVITIIGFPGIFVERTIKLFALV